MSDIPNTEGQQPAFPGAGGSPALSLIAAERQRQIDAEGWTSEHDDAHAAGQMACAAACYAMPHFFRQSREIGLRLVPMDWPWEPEWWKPTNDRVRELVKAGALIVAEIERLQRQDKRTKPAERPHFDHEDAHRKAGFPSNR